MATLLVVVAAGVIDSPLFTFYRISGNSMRPSFRDGDRVLVTRVPVLFDYIEVGDAVIAEHAGEVLIKRVMAGPGDVLEMRAGVVYVDGQPVETPPDPNERDYWSVAPMRLGPDEYYVLGDNRRVSVDSRAFGPIRRDEILGWVCMRFAGDDDDRPVTAAER